MTAEELIAELQKVDPKKTVVVNCLCSGYATGEIHDNPSSSLLDNHDRLMEDFPNGYVVIM